jgi:hypothetical protein
MAIARINIESDLFTKKRWTDLVIALGDRDRALGALSWAWIVAQQFYVPERNPIPKDVWVDEGLCDELIKVGLAKEVDGGIHMCGSDEQFAWLFQRHEAGAKGGRPKKTESPPDPETHETGDNRPVSSDNREKPEETGDNRAKPSYSSSSSISKSNTHKKGGVGENKSRKTQFDFEPLFAIYPNPEGKAAGMARLRVSITTAERFEQFSAAVKNYAAHMATLKRAPDKIKHWSTFVGDEHIEPWTDYISPPKPLTLASGAVSKQPLPEAYLPEIDAYMSAKNRFGIRDSDKAREWLTPDRWPVIESLGGWSVFSRMGDGDPERRQIYQAIKQLEEPKGA